MIRRTGRSPSSLTFDAKWRMARGKAVIACWFALGVLAKHLTRAWGLGVRTFDAIEASRDLERQPSPLIDGITDMAASRCRPTMDLTRSSTPTSYSRRKVVMAITPYPYSDASSRTRARSRPDG